MSLLSPAREQFAPGHFLRKWQIFVCLYDILRKNLAEELENMPLEIGEEYISYAQNYHDSYKDLIAELKTRGFGHVAMKPYDPAKLKVPSEEIASGAWV